MQKLGKWLDNYWYHYKWQTLIVLFLVVVGSICIGQMVTKEDYDTSVLYGGPATFTPDQIRETELALALMLGEDYNRDGQKNATVVSFTLMTEEQRKEALREAEEKGETLIINTQNLEENRNSFVSQLTMGDSVICFLDPAWYEVAKENNGFAPLATVLGKKPEKAIDDYCIRLHDLAFASYFSAFSAFPDDTVVAVRTRPVINGIFGSDKREEEYRVQLDIFRAMMAWG